MATIVISYRRADSQAITGRIFDRLENHFGRRSVFMDIDAIPPGADFRNHITDTLSRCDVLLAIIGPSWVEGPDGNRLNDETDWVRIEIETALQNNIPIIPVVIDRVEMPKPRQLPETLRALAFRQAIRVDSGIDFKPHVARLIGWLDQSLKTGPAAKKRIRARSATGKEVRPPPETRRSSASKAAALTGTAKATEPAQAIDKGRTEQQPVLSAPSDNSENLPPLPASGSDHRSDSAIQLALPSTTSNEDRSINSGSPSQEYSLYGVFTDGGLAKDTEPPYADPEEDVIKPCTAAEVTRAAIDPPSAPELSSAPQIDNRPEYPSQAAIVEETPSESLVLSTSDVVEETPSEPPLLSVSDEVKEPEPYALSLLDEVKEREADLGGITENGNRNTPGPRQDRGTLIDVPAKFADEGPAAPPIELPRDRIVTGGAESETLRQPAAAGANAPEDVNRAATTDSQNVLESPHGTGTLMDAVWKSVPAAQRIPSFGLRGKVVGSTVLFALALVALYLVWPHQSQLTASDHAGGLPSLVASPSAGAQTQTPVAPAQQAGEPPHTDDTAGLANTDAPASAVPPESSPSAALLTPEPFDPASVPPIPASRVSGDEIDSLQALAESGKWEQIDQFIGAHPGSSVQHVDRTDARDWNKAGKRFFDRMDFARATDAFQRALRRDPADIEIRNNLADALLEFGQIDNSINLLRDVLMMNPVRDPAWANLSEALATADKSSSAGAALLLTMHFSSDQPRTLAFFDAGSAQWSEKYRALVQQFRDQLGSVPPYKAKTD